MEFIDRLVKSTPHGQIWIATHSIHVLSQISPDSLWYVDNGHVEWAGRRPEKVLKSLVGDEERVGQLERFIHLPAVYAMERFAAECLLAPAILTTGADDKQSNQIRNLIEKKRINGSPLRVLDYGAGQGRILATLRQNRDDLSHSIDYRALEPNDSAREHCIGAVADAYGTDQATAKDRVFQSEDDLRQRLQPKTVDIAILCNVLHEIHPRKWRRLFTEQELPYALKQDGHLLLLEDMKIPYGEKAHENGFILLDTEQLQTLFAVNREDPSEFVVYTEDDRLKAYLIRADVIKRVTDGTIKESLERRLASSGDRIQELRQMEATYANGRLLALYTAIYANTALALRG